MRSLYLSAALILLASGVYSAVVKDCQSKQLDVIFVVDVSKSISDNELSEERDAIHGVIEGFQLGKNETLFGVIAYAKEPEVAVPFGKYTSSKSIKKSELVPRLKEYVGTFTNLALDMVVAEFGNFSRKGTKKIGVIITDGKSNDVGKTIASAENIHENHPDITLVVIGIGQGALKEGRGELQAIATGKGDQNVIFISSLKSFSELHQKVARETCKAPSKPAEKKQCPNLCIENGAAIGGVMSGDDVMISCVTGYHLVGKNEMYCDDDGKWSETIPTCDKDPICPAVTSVDFGRVEKSDGSNLPNGSVTFKCEKGYTLQGADKLTCGSDGQWDNPLPECVEARCPFFYTISDGYIVRQNNNPTETVRFACNDGFALVGNETLKCGSNGEWNKPAPVCEEAKCEHIVQFENGIIDNYDRVYGSRPNFTCNEGYEIQGARTVYCSRSADAWNRDAPKCVRNSQTEDELKRSKSFKACPYFTLEHGSCSGSTNKGRRMKCRCERGFQLNGVAELTCGNNQTWNHAYPTCVSRQCQALKFVENGKLHGVMKAPFMIGRTLRVRCDKGYVLHGNSRVTCTANGTWTEIPECLALRCPHVTSFENGRVIGYDNRPGAKAVKFMCHPGYTLVGVKESRCTGKGNWTKDFPVCILDSVCHAPCPRNGSITQKLVNGVKIVTYFCDKGYLLNGTVERRCKNGKWNNDEPICQVLPSSPKEECIGKSVDVSFIVDISKSISEREMEEERNALKIIFSKLNVSPNATRVNLITFHKTAQEEFPLTEYTSRSALANAHILKRGFIRGGTQTAEALLLMMAQARKTHGRERIAVVLTDGRATVPLANTISALDATNIKRIAIGVGKDSDTRELKAIAGDDGNVYDAHDYHELGNIADAIVSKVCSLSDGVPAGPSASECFAPIQQATTSPVPMTTTRPPVTTTSTSAPQTTTPKQEVLPAKPVVACVEKYVDVTLVVDISKSISAKELEQERSVVRLFLNGFDIGPNKTRVALVKYNKYAELEFGFDRFSSREAFQKAHVLTREDKIEGGTKTALGMEKAMEYLDENSGAGKSKVIILLTDGKATEPLDDMITALENTDIKAIVVGIGKKADQSELESIATGKGDSNVYSADDFEKLKESFSDIVQQACTD